MNLAKKGLLVMFAINVLATILHYMDNIMFSLPTRSHLGSTRRLSTYSDLS